MILFKSALPASLLLFFVLAISCTQAQKSSNTDNAPALKVVKTNEEWRAILTPEQYFILREKGTERAYSGQYDKHFEKGIYTCAGCGIELFTSQHKYDSKCGWPAFYDEVDKGVITRHEDRSYGMNRIEIRCASCGGHLGHVFPDGPKPTGERYCVNSLSLNFLPKANITK
jgi:peptide-methionine (R)-S-oxide reductase